MLLPVSEVDVRGQEHPEGVLRARAAAVGAHDGLGLSAVGGGELEHVVAGRVYKKIQREKKKKGTEKAGNI